MYKDGIIIFIPCVQEFVAWGINMYGIYFLAHYQFHWLHLSLITHNPLTWVILFTSTLENLIEYIYSKIEIMPSSLFKITTVEQLPCAGYILGWYWFAITNVRSKNIFLGVYTSTVGLGLLSRYKLNIFMYARLWISKQNQ